MIKVPPTIMHPRDVSFPPQVSPRGWNATCWRYKPLKERIKEHIKHKVFGVICSTPDEKYLLVRGRLGGKWSFPKGHLKASEIALDCALRELHEETGITLSRKDVSFLTTTLSKNRDGNNAEYFRCLVPEEIPVNIIDNREISEAGWFTLCEIQRLNGNIDVTNFGIQNGFPPIREARIQ
jgi:8-oxo-dGTP pyrophosphatase MutT (NUDIX family)|uniref:Nudix hydrolase domain-containing protein n=1 Tax=viral metagenome TaxID=1070528 RepID=A0A6C0K682_9ZZZZ